MEWPKCGWGVSDLFSFRGVGISTRLDLKIIDSAELGGGAPIAPSLLWFRLIMTELELAWTGYN